MVTDLQQLDTTTFLGKRFTRNQLARIQETVSDFSDLTLRELAHTICEHFQWITPKGTYKVQFCLGVLDALENEGLLILPQKRPKKRYHQKKIIWTDKTKTQEIINCSIEELMPLKLELATEKNDITEWNEFVDRYHYLGYKRPIGCYIKYFITSNNGKKLGCLLFSYATKSLMCRDKWIGWSSKERAKYLELVINNNRFLIFPWVDVKNLASKTLSIVSSQIADDWERIHGYRPFLLETFVDPSKYKGTCYQASNWEYIGKSVGKKLKTNTINPKDYYAYPLSKDFRLFLKGKKKLQKIPIPKQVTVSKNYDPLKSDDPFIQLWQRVINIVFTVAYEFDQKWQKRNRILNTMLIILFIFRLVFSKNKQGYSITIEELWAQCKTMKVPLPQSKPVAASAFCVARKKLDENIFKTLNSKIIKTYENKDISYKWNNLMVFAVDGTKINLPRQLRNIGYKVPSCNANYPQGLVSCLYQLKSNIPYDFDLVNHQNERLAARSHLKVLRKDDVVIYDRGYFSYVMLYYHIKKQIHSVFRLQNNTYKVITEFMISSETDKVVEIMPSNQTKKEILLNYQDIEVIPLKLRLIKYTILGTQYTLGTTLLDNNIYKTESFMELYHSRWGIEELYKISKVLIDVEDFHGQTERGVKQELFAHFVLITLKSIFANHSETNLIQNQNILTPLTSPDKFKVNVKNCLVTIARNLEGLFIRQADLVCKTVNNIINTVYNCRQKERPNRSYKRQSLKPLKKWQAQKKLNIKVATA